MQEYDELQPTAELGRRLFFDPVLSNNGSVSCATCHVPERGYSNGRPPGRTQSGTLAMKAPSLLDRGSGKHFFWDGRASSLEEQSLQPIAEPSEMGGPLTAAVERAGRKYPAVKSAADLASALAAYERTLVSPRSRWDEYISGRNTLALTEAEMRGWDLFRGAARCSSCHTGRLLTDESFHDTGVQEHALGRKAVTGRDEDAGKWKTPGLRAVKLTAPYMHDGSVPTLQDVVEHYSRGGGEARPLRLTPREKADLVAFLRCL